MKGTRTILCFTLAMGVAGATALGNVRLFMAVNGTQTTQPVTGNTTMTMDPGQTVSVDVWMQDTTVSNPLLNGYQLIFPWNAAMVSGSGSVHYNDIPPTGGAGNSIVVDAARPDWIFAGQPIQPVFYQEAIIAGVPNRFGCIYNLPFMSGINAQSPNIKYLATFGITADAGTNGVFELPFRTSPAPSTQMFDPFGGVFPTDELQKLTIIVGPQPEACCFANGSCSNILAGSCTGQGGSPHGPGSNCANTTCPVAPFVVHETGQTGQTRPCSGYIDPRRESTNGTDFNDGLSTLTIKFSEPVFAVGGGALTPASFEVLETGYTLAIEQSQEVPPSGSAARGRATVSVNALGTQARIRITHSLAGVTAGHVHRGLPGVNGPIVFALPSAVSPVDATWNIGVAELGLLRAGNYYINLHSAAFPGGEIRGQIPPNKVMAVDATMNPLVNLTLTRKISLQEWTTVRANVQDASGQAIVNLGNLGAMNEPDRVDLGFLPADINQSSNITPLDLLKFKQYVNNLATPDCGIKIDFIDTDRNGASSPLDLLAFKRLINGISPATQSWSAKTMNNPRP